MLLAAAAAVTRVLLFFFPSLPLFPCTSLALCEVQGCDRYHGLEHGYRKGAIELGKWILDSLFKFRACWPCTFLFACRCGCATSERKWQLQHKASKRRCGLLPVCFLSTEVCFSKRKYSCHQFCRGFSGGVQSFPRKGQKVFPTIMYRLVEFFLASSILARLSWSV